MSLDTVPAETFSTAPPETSVSSLSLSRLKRSTNLALSQRLAPLLKAVSSGEIGGETLDDAWTVVERVSARGDAYTLGLWDDASYRAAELVEEAHDAIERIRTFGADGYLSIKPPALGFDGAVARELGRAAARANVRLHCDSHGIEVADRTFQFMADLAREAAPELLSVTIPGRWRRSASDAVRMLRAGIGIRIVKGQWADPEDAGMDLRRGFLAVVDAVQNSGGSIALASHDAALIQWAAAKLDLDEAGYQLEYIQGLVTPALWELAVRSGHPARIYVPYGRGFVPSTLQILRRNPRLGISLVSAALARKDARVPGRAPTRAA